LAAQRLHRRFRRVRSSLTEYAASVSSSGQSRKHLLGMSISPKRPTCFLQDRASWQRQCDAVGNDAGRQQRRAARYFRCNPPGQVESKGKAIVSTHRGNYPTIPRTDLLAEIGKRASNNRNYADAFKKAGKKPAEVPKFGEFEKESFAKSPFAPILSACWGRKAISTWRSNNSVRQPCFISSASSL
jgi:hypothetical protein